MAESAWDARVDFGGKVLALMVPLAPAVGLGVRWLAFAITPGLGAALPAAAAQSLTELSAAGAWFLLLGFFGFAFFLLLTAAVNGGWRNEVRVKSEPTKWQRLARRVGLVSFGLAAVAGVYGVLVAGRLWPFFALFTLGLMLWVALNWKAIRGKDHHEGWLVPPIDWGGPVSLRP